MSNITVSELIDALDKLILLDCFLAVLFALVIKDMATFIFYNLSDFIRSAIKGRSL